MRRHTARAWLAGLTLAAAPAWANDTSIGDDNGTITFAQQPGISMDSERLLLSEEAVEVAYRFTNHGSADITTPVAFPMPQLVFDGGDRNTIQDFRVWVDDKPVRPDRRFVVKLDGREDISAQVTKLGWTEKDLLAYLESGEVPKGRKPLPAAWIKGHEVERPRITASEYFVWPQTFPAGRTLSIRHRYQPAVTTGVPQPADALIEGYGAQACVDASARSGIRKRAEGNGAAYGFLRYVLTTANNWRGPIGDFHLIIRKRLPTDVMSLCFDGELKKTDSTTFEFQARDFRPTRDISLLFVRKPGD